MKPTTGRIVHYVMGPGRAAGMHRPAIIVAVCNERFNTTSYTREECQLQIFVDGTNDVENSVPGVPSATVWGTSVPHDEDKKPGTWHWPEREE